ncbi:MAG: Jag N-terminal domain-containing protein [Desulfovibrio sp.]|jgi:spoIIIJ-associated protein|nr:Jag N-terminal domain-containing protein [Desulfovibrio sp.]
MNTQREFQGRTLDEAIREACDYFGVEREKLEIEIVRDASFGIFGLMGARKASIRASRVDLSSILDPEEEAAQPLASAGPRPRLSRDDAPRDSGSGYRAEAGRDRSGRPPPPENQSRESAPAEALREEAECRPLPEKSIGERSSCGREESARPILAEHSGAGAEEVREDMPEMDLQNCDQAAILALVTETAARLARPIVGEISSNAVIDGNRVRVSIDCGESSGILLGREGQTLAAVQYIAGRIIARKLGGNVLLQMDAGNYRERQDERLRELARDLAEKARISQRVQATRPLSAYQRRIIHIALEKNESVQTFSKGEGNQRRVIIQPRRTDHSLSR